MTQPVSLADLDPMPGEFFLKKTKKTYTIRPITIGDQKFLKHMFGDEDAIKAMFEGMDHEKLSKLVYFLMDQQGRKDFLSQEIEEINEEGIVATKTVSGPEALMNSIEYPSEFLEVFKALIKTIGISNAVIDKIEMQEVKKKAKKQLK